MRASAASPLRLAASRIGGGVPLASFSGRVVGATARSALIELSDGGLVALIADASGGVPAAVSLPLPAGFEFAGHLRVGEPCAARGGILRVGALAIDLRGARPWRAELNSLPPPERIGLSARRALLAELIGESGRAEALLRIAEDRNDRLARAAGTLDPRTGETLVALLGMGEGTTPAGDDFVVGYLASLWTGSKPDTQRSEFAARVSRRVAEESTSTTRTSRVYLMAAAQGDVAERLYDLAVCLATAGPASTFDAAMRAALDIGHTSGACAALGLRAGSLSWDRGPV